MAKDAVFDTWQSLGKGDRVMDGSKENTLASGELVFKKGVVRSIDFDKVKTVEDVKLILAAVNFTWRNANPEAIAHFLRVDEE